MQVTIGLADDHQLFLKSLSILINSFSSCEVVLEASNGRDLLHKLELPKARPDILLVDVGMPVMDGIKVAKVVSEKYPEIKISALSGKDDDFTIINMIKAGCCSYLPKDIHPNELEKAIAEIALRGYYNGDASNINCRRLLEFEEKDKALSLSEIEKTFLKLACSDLTYKEIAVRMSKAERTIDGYRETLFHKFEVQSRVGMVLEAIRRNIVVIN